MTMLSLCYRPEDFDKISGSSIASVYYVVKLKHPAEVKPAIPTNPPAAFTTSSGDEPESPAEFGTTSTSAPANSTTSVGGAGAAPSSAGATSSTQEGPPTAKQVNMIPPPPPPPNIVDDRTPAASAPSGAGQSNAQPGISDELPESGSLRRGDSGSSSGSSEGEKGGSHKKATHWFSKARQSLSSLASSAQQVAQGIVANDPLAFHEQLQRIVILCLNHVLVVSREGEVGYHTQKRVFGLLQGGSGPHEFL